MGQHYPLGKILGEQGKPSEIWIHAVGVNTISPQGRFTLAFYWRERGILAEFDGTMEKTNPLLICLDTIDESSTPLWLWDSGDRRTFQEVKMGLFTDSPPSLPDFIQLENATNINVDTFFERYSNLGNVYCFEMPDPDIP